MKIDFDGRLWDFGLEEMDVAQCEAVEKYVGKGLGEWSNQMAAGSVKSIIALWWVMRAQAGDNPGPVGDPGAGFMPVKLLVALNAAVDAEQAAGAEVAAEAEADPTRTPAGSPGPAGTATTGDAAAAASRPG
jgi:hypothetical protein